MQQHCDDCSKGVLSEGSPKGSIQKFGGVDCYLIRPENGSNKKVVVIATDAFGPTLINTQLIADSISHHCGWMVLIPDLFDNDPLDSSVFSEPDAAIRGKIVGTWMAKHGPPDKKVPLFHEVIKKLKEDGFEKIGFVGYCFGGRISTLLASQDLVNANAIVHPARLNIPSEIDTIKNPTLWICAETDPTFPLEDQKKVQEIMEKRGAIFKHYPGTTHGFATRGDDKDPVIRKAKVDALEQIINFLNSKL